MLKLKYHQDCRVGLLQAVIIGGLSSRIKHQNQPVFQDTEAVIKDRHFNLLGPLMRRNRRRRMNINGMRINLLVQGIRTNRTEKISNRRLSKWGKRRPRWSRMHRFNNLNSIKLNSKRRQKVPQQFRTQLTLLQIIKNFQIIVLILRICRDQDPVVYVICKVWKCLATSSSIPWLSWIRPEVFKLLRLSKISTLP